MSLSGRIINDIRRFSEYPPLPLHCRWIRAVFHPDIEIGVLSIPRGNAKSWICAQLLGISLRPGSSLFREGLETLLVSASMGQSRVTMRMIREHLADVADDYRFLDSGTRMQITRKSCNTKMRVLSNSGKRSLGLEGFSFVVADEPSAYEARGGHR